MVNDAPEPGVMFADQPGNGVDRHRGDQAHDQRLEQQSEPAVRPCPGHAERLDPAASAMHARHAGVQKRLVLEEVEMPPAHLLGVVCQAQKAQVFLEAVSKRWSAMLASCNLKFDKDLQFWQTLCP